jgi:DNA-binding NarL/FixJ family response regulator
MSRSGTNLRTSTAAPLGSRRYSAGRLGRPPCATGALTAREQQVVDLVCDAHNNESIGHQLNISEETAKRHLSTIFEKLKVNTRLELAIQVLNQRHAAELADVMRNVEAIRNNTWADLQSN